ncbi:PIN domain-containing protein [Bdellovibrionota bacterium FG-2]
MILVDSCVWIDLLKKRKNKHTLLLENLAHNLLEEVCISHVIYFEVLRGITSDLERKKLASSFEKMAFFDFRNDGFDAWIAIYRKCTRSGVNLPRLGDWMIAKTAVDHDLELLTSDQDFLAIAEHVGPHTPLRIVSV